MERHGASIIRLVPARRTEHLVLVTLDGVRPREVFGGLDLEILRATTRQGRAEDGELHRRYWAPTPEARRARLMPFLWGELLARHGSIAGNADRGSVARIANRHRISYPGYAELLTGEVHDDLIASNAQRQSPLPTVLEFARERLGLGVHEVAAFASWETLRWIVESRPGTITANAGRQPYDDPDPAVRAASELQLEAPPPWERMRHDAVTMRLARAHLARFAPRVLYVGLGETDDWAHDGRYDRHLEAVARADAFLADLWAWLEASPRYAGRTTLVVTTDHGRGLTTEDWRQHEAGVDGAEAIWLAVAGPDTPRRGEWTDAPPITLGQVAATCARLLGLDYGAARPAAAPPIAALVER
jgi:hypothetical protein